MLEEDLPVLVEGKVSVSEEELPKIRAEKMKPLTLTAIEERLCLIELRASKLRQRTLYDLQKLLQQHQGDCPVVFKYIDPDNSITRIRAGDNFQIHPSEQLAQQIEELVGKHSVFVSVA
jgi:DNA polymerase-3 subunit alpha